MAETIRPLKLLSTGLRPATVGAMPRDLKPSESRDAALRELTRLYLKALERYIRRMVRLVDDLVDFIRTERDALELQWAWVEVDRLVADLLDEYRTTFEARRVQLSFAGRGAPLWAHADSHRLVQVFSNLLDNALKFTPAGGSVTVEMTLCDQNIEIRVRDTGRGLRSDVLPRILDLPTDLTKPHGLGIGLAVARRITELHGGAIVVKSDGPGLGTEVVISLPAAEPGLRANESQLRVAP